MPFKFIYLFNSTEILIFDPISGVEMGKKNSISGVDDVGSGNREDKENLPQ